MSDFISENKIAYDAIATPFSQSRTARYGELVMLTEYIQPGDCVLDLGCGTGRLYQLLKENQVLTQGTTYIGVDQSQGQLDVAQKDFPKGKWVQGDMFCIPLKDDSVSIIYCIATFHHLPDSETRIKALEEMKRVLRPDGKIIMSNWNFESDWVASKLAGPDTPGVESKWVREGDHFIVPWMNPKREILGSRHYWAISPEDHEYLYNEAGFEMLDWFYTRREEKIDDIKLGMNIVTIARNV